MPLLNHPLGEPDDGAWRSPDALALRVVGSLVETTGEGSRVALWRPADKIEAGTQVLMGEHRSRQRIAALLDGAPDDGSSWAELSDLMGSWGSADAEGRLLPRAVAMANWHQATRYCRRCGGAVTPVAAGTEVVCSNGHGERPRIDLAVIMLITDGEPAAPNERCLLGRRSGTAEPRYSALAGFYEPGESAEDAVRREVAEEAGVLVNEVSYVGSQSWPMPSSLMLGYVGRAASTAISCDQQELLDARWFTRAEVTHLTRSGAMTLPGRHTLSRSLIETWRGFRTDDLHSSDLRDSAP